MTLSSNLDVKVSFIECCIYAFRKIGKRNFYTYCYGDVEAYKIWTDFQSMYCMGGEL